MLDSSLFSYDLVVGNDDVQMVVKCEFCNEEFDCEILLQSHQNFFHKNYEANYNVNVYNPLDSENIIPIKFNCYNCKFIAKNIEEILSHHSFVWC